MLVVYSFRPLVGSHNAVNADNGVILQTHVSILVFTPPPPCGMNVDHGDNHTIFDTTIDPQQNIGGPTTGVAHKNCTTHSSKQHHLEHPSQYAPHINTVGITHKCSRYIPQRNSRKNKV